jgi:hypothetical protein
MIMTLKQLEARVAKLEHDLALLLQKIEPKKEGWRAWVGAFSNDPYMKEAFAIAQEYRERDRQKARRTHKRRRGKEA